MALRVGLRKGELIAVKWGDKGENEITLDPYDFVHVPPGVVRTFVNVGDEDGELLVIARAR